ncbi:MAG: S8 family serine peptidase, partial [Nitrososphaeria archaeon]|nr:S8 family serine peptidase [Nitrososphaeria archaeon]
MFKAKFLSIANEFRKRSVLWHIREVKVIKYFIVLTILLQIIFSSVYIGKVDSEVEVIIVLDDEPASIIAKKYGLPIKFEFIKEIENEKAYKVSLLLKDISRNIPIKIETVFTKVIVGALLKTYSRFIQQMNSIKGLKLLDKDEVYSLELGNSVKMVGADRVWNLRDSIGQNITGKGVKVAVLDTGVNYSIPALGGGFGLDYKVVGGYDFVDNDPDPMDLDGHGTSVATIIAGRNENFSGVAPDAMILAYRVITSEGQTTTSKIIKALEKAVEDGASVVNLSFGGSSLQASLGIALKNMVESNVVVVAAAGNSGPKSKSIEFPSSLNYVICVGASSNIGAGNLKAEFKANELGKSFEAIPLNGTVQTLKPLKGELVYVGLGGKEEVANLDLNGKIAIAKRGKYYFSDKAKNVYERGAIALVVFNNVSDIFVGMLKDMVPIPVISLSGDDGEKIVKELNYRKLTAELSIFEDDYQPAWFTSRGPISPFYIKPNLLAPGDAIVTINLTGKYTNISGTSFAAPHVSGAVALIRQAMPKLGPREIMNLLMDSALPLSTGEELYSVNVQGGGLMQVDNAIKSDFIMDPGYLIFHLSPSNQTEFERSLRIYSLSREKLNITISNIWDNFEVFSLEVENIRMLNKSMIEATLKAKLIKGDFGLYFGWLNISSSKCIQHLP